mmetsp:Transcript_12256/g.22296  ORF Transcript_12256/g.22296 Transcript_12256/m.22296 type:complete len:108 (+) Transcript_12256:61-384(+)
MCSLACMYVPAYRTTASMPRYIANALTIPPSPSSPPRNSFLLLSRPSKMKACPSSISPPFIAAATTTAASTPTLPLLPLALRLIDKQITDDGSHEAVGTRDPKHPQE